MRRMTPFRADQSVISVQKLNDMQRQIEILTRAVMGMAGGSYQGNTGIAFSKMRRTQNTVGGGGSSGGVLARVKNDGGSGGSGTTVASWTYGIWPANILPSSDPTNASRIQATVPFINRGTEPGLIVVAPENSFALIALNPLAVDPLNPWILILVGEVPDTAVCS